MSEQRLKSSESWNKRTFSMDGFVSASGDSAASLDFPIEITQLSLIRSEASEIQTGKIYFDQVTVEYSEILHVKESLKSERWMGVLTKSAVRWGELSIELAIELIGIMMLWLGLMRIGEKAGLVQFLARMVKPIMRRLFPEIPPEGEAIGSHRDEYRC